MLIMFVPRYHARYVTVDISNTNKNLCGRDGRTICGPQCVPKSTSVTLAGCCLAITAGPVATITGRTDRQTDRQSATHNAAPSQGGEPHKKRKRRAILVTWKCRREWWRYLRRRTGATQFTNIFFSISGKIFSQKLKKNIFVNWVAPVRFRRY